MIRTLIVDDEPLARDGLRLLLQEIPDVEIAGEACDGQEAVDRIRSLMPDLVLLDVQMPEMDGFEVVRRVAEQHLPLVVFVTAHEQFALRAFEVHALDYLLKPVSRERLLDMMARVRQELAREDRENAGALARLVESGAGAAAKGEPLRRFVVKERGRYLLVRDDEVAWIEGMGNYAGLHARGQVFPVRSTLTQLERRLDPVRFVRIHRSTIVNVEGVREIVPDGGGDFLVHLGADVTLRLSRNYRDRLLPRD